MWNKNGSPTSFLSYSNFMRKLSEFMPSLCCHSNTDIVKTDFEIFLSYWILLPLSSTNISGVRAPDRKVSPKTWRILRHNRPTFMGASTDQWLKCPCATEFNPPWFYSWSEVFWIKFVQIYGKYMFVFSVILPKS